MKKFLTLALTTVMALSLLTACGSKNDNNADTNTDGSNTETTLSGTVSTDGSTSMEKVINSLGESFMAMNKDVKFTYNPTGSGSGIQAVSADRCDIGLSSRALKDDEKASGLVETVVALDGIAIVVNPENPVSDLDIDTIAKIYTGEITNWKDVGGNDAEIVLIGREAGSGTRDGFESITDTKDFHFHVGMPVLMKRTAHHSISVYFHPILLGSLPGSHKFLNTLKNTHSTFISHP